MIGTQTNLSHLCKFLLNSCHFNVIRCLICLQEFKNKEKIRVIDMCKHIFHGECLLKWLQSEEKCPVCKKCLHKRFIEIFGKQERENSVVLCGEYGA